MLLETDHGTQRAADVPNMNRIVVHKGTRSKLVLEAGPPRHAQHFGRGVNQQRVRCGGGGCHVPQFDQSISPATGEDTFVTGVPFHAIRGRLMALHRALRLSVVAYVPKLELAAFSYDGDNFKFVGPPGYIPEKKRGLGLSHKSETKRAIACSCKCTGFLSPDGVVPAADNGGGGDGAARGVGADVPETNRRILLQKHKEVNARKRGAGELLELTWPADASRAAAL